MANFFISYRREDTEDITGRLGDRLKNQFGSDSVFTDVDDIPIGVDFRQVLGEKVSQCVVLLAVIGRSWLTVKTPDGQRRLDNESDFVRIEIEFALKRDIPVVPVLVQNSAMPTAESLPDSLQNLAFRHAVEIRSNPHFHHDVDRLIAGLQAHIDAQSAKDNFTQAHVDLDHLQTVTATCPEWASDRGQDNFGSFVEIAVEPVNGGAEVVQRLRWIPPGEFWMGSPEDEKGRWNDEGPRHRVRLTDGYWLFDTPVTQAFWQAVMGKNPSRFVSETRPVERVTFDDVEAFLNRVNERYPGLELSLATESQWEYACRAGVEDATYCGPLEIKGERNAPILNTIAWYGGNSSEGFELDNGVDSSDWLEMRIPGDSSGTHPVGQKQANDWGLYDMLGNVYEWCKDSLRGYDNKVVENPEGEEASARVVRGGSWRSYARHMRAAYRSQGEANYHYDNLGFRCLRVQERE